LHKISVPLSVPVSKKKKFYLNLNQYRNAHHHTLAKAKVNYHDILEPLLAHLPRFHRIELTYTLFPGTRQLCDVSNICTIVDKFFSDSLVSCKKIEDDNLEFVPSVRFRYGGVDKFNPRVEVVIEPIGADTTEEEEDMQIIIVQSEIEAAIEAQIREQIVVRDDYRIDIELRATRGEDGYQAIIDIVPVNSERKAPSADTGVAATVKVTKAASAPAAPKAPKAPKAVAAPVETVVEEVVVTEVEPPISEVAMATELAEDATPFDGGVEVAPVEPVAEPVGGSSEPVPVKRPSLFGNMTTPTNN
jgi:hypothetical protein